MVHNGYLVGLGFVVVDFVGEERSEEWFGTFIQAERVNSVTFLRLVGNIIMIVDEDFRRELLEIYIEHFDKSGGSVFDSVHKRWVISLLTDLFFLGNVGETHWDLWLTHMGICGGTSTKFFNHGGLKWDNLICRKGSRVFNHGGLIWFDDWNGSESVGDLNC